MKTFLDPIVWRFIKGYENIYQISNNGQVKSLRNNKILSPGKTTSGYNFVLLSVKGKRENKMIHRLVAETFIPNPNGLREINHIDGDKDNNVVTNLEWCTRRDNLKHAVDNGLRYSQCNIIRGVKMVCPNGEIKLFKSMKECGAYFNHSKSWLGYHIAKNGNPCEYNGYVITVSDRGGGVRL